MISPLPLRKQPPRDTKSFNSGSLGVTELLQVFLELEELDDKQLRPAVVHGRKKLQALAGTGATITEAIDVITIEEVQLLIKFQWKYYQQGEKNHNQSACTLKRHSLRLVS